MMSDDVKNISIIGCGWLGLPLAERLIKDGYSVKGSTTRMEKLPVLKSKGIAPYCIVLGQNDTTAFTDFFESDILIIDFPPRRIPNIKNLYPKQIQECVDRAVKGGIRKVLFTSSTSVYPNLNREVVEYDSVNPEKDSGQAVLIAEEVLISSEVNYAIIRFGGLIGEDRNPIHSISKRKIILEGDSPMNLIHLTDCIEIITEVIKQDKWNRVYNACAPEHPKRSDFYKKASEKSQVPMPEFKYSEDLKYKKVNSDRLINELSYSFIYPDPLKMY